VFAKLPGGEPVKTRLQPFLTLAQAERFQLACLADTLETAAQVVEHPVLFWTAGSLRRRSARTATDADAPPDLGPALRELGVPADVWERVACIEQVDGDLGRRLEHAFVLLAAAAGAPQPLLVIGSDSPGLGAPALVQALALLGDPEGGKPPDVFVAPDDDGRSPDVVLTPAGGVGASPDLVLRPAADGDTPPDLVLGPADDGGFWCIGVRRPITALLRDVEWSTARTLASTCEHAVALGLRVGFAPPWWDVDRPEDLQRLARHIAACRAAGDERTARHSARVLHDFGSLRGAATPGS
jgi:glycosyltransferase A (GT-A) superfamily protein (DUF2064 family)